MRMLGSNPTDSQVQELVNEKDFDGKTLCLLITLVGHLLIGPESVSPCSPLHRRVFVLYSARHRVLLPALHFYFHGAE